jgi:hypothetical protein
MVTIFVPDIPEFMPLIQGARNLEDCRIQLPRLGYWRIEADQEICFGRKALGLGPALWNSALTGGFRGRITEYSRDVLRIEAET